MRNFLGYLSSCDFGNRRAAALLVALGAATAICCATTAAPIDSVSGAAGAEKIEDGLEVAPTDWPWWRGPRRDGSAEPGQQIPLHWSESENVAWKSPIPGHGHSSPILVGPRIFLTTSDPASGAQSVLCLDRDSGATRWQTVVHRAGAMVKNVKSSGASSSAACDGQRVFVNFPNDGAVYTTALDLEGRQLWQTKISDYVIHQGYGSSPALYQGLVIASADNKAGGALAALDARSGDVVWRRERPATPNYPSPIIQHVAGRDQLLLTGCDHVSSFDPLTGQTLWEIEGATTECVTSTVAVGDLVISSGGFPRNHMAAIRADGSGEVAWQHDTRLYVPSPLVRDGYLYGVLDAGIAVCWNGASGEEIWKKRLGGNFTASPVLIGELILATNEDGESFIFEATPNGFQQRGSGDLGDQVFATPTVCGDRIYMRVAHGVGDQRQEMLYCLAK